MSTTPDPDLIDETTAWEEVAAHREILEHIVENDLPFAPYAQRLLDELDRRDV